jgi:hypothetical protein
MDTMHAVSKLDLNYRRNKFEEHSKKTLEAERRKAEKERILQERANARKEAHLAAVAELRRRQAEEVEKVCFDVSLLLSFSLERAIKP